MYPFDCYSSTYYTRLLHQTTPLLARRNITSRMDTDAGRRLRTAIKNDATLTNQITESPHIVGTSERHDEVYYSDETSLDVSGLGHYVDTVGDVVYGARIEVPEDADLDAIAERLVTLARDCLDVESPLVWAHSNFGTYRVYIECESLLKRAAEEHSTVAKVKSPEDLYDLRFETTHRDATVLHR